MGIVTTPIDYSPLFVPLSRTETADFRRESRQRREAWATVPPSLIAIGVIAVLFTLFAFFGVAATGEWTALSVVFMPLIVLALAAVAVGHSLLDPRRWQTMLRRVLFASANGLTYLHEAPAPGHPGLIFGLGDRRRCETVLHRAEPALELGSYRYTTGSGKNRATWRWGYVALRLPRRLPHMLLDARGNNSILGSNVPIAFDRSQVLSLEGDFDRHFTLYCPKEYERDALYVFTPDLMALLIDESAGFDVEIVDDWLFLYTRGTLRIDDPHTLQRVFSIVDTVGAKAHRQTRRYSDERIGDRSVDLVAPRGQRLRRRVTTSQLTWVVIGVVLFTVIVQGMLR